MLSVPLQAVIDGSVLCVHGGLSPDVRTLDQVRMIDRVCEIPHEGPFCDLMWSDPEEIESWAVSPRGAGEAWSACNSEPKHCDGHCWRARTRHVQAAAPWWGGNIRRLLYHLAPFFTPIHMQHTGWLFGGKVATEFNAVNGLELICRAHQLVQVQCSCGAASPPAPPHRQGGKGGRASSAVTAVHYKQLVCLSHGCRTCVQRGNARYRLQLTALFPAAAGGPQVHVSGQVAGHGVVST